MGKNLFEKITDSDGDEVCSPSLHHHEAGWVGVMGLYTPPHPPTPHPSQFTRSQEPCEQGEVLGWVTRWTVSLLSADYDDVLLYSSFPLTRMLKEGGGGGGGGGLG